MDIKFTFKNILLLLVFFWIVFSLTYVVNDLINKYESKEQAYRQGGIDTINLLIEEAEKCQPFSVYSQEKEIRLINLDCLEQENLDS
jgi:hypothetical protein